MTETTTPDGYNTINPNPIKFEVKWDSDTGFTVNMIEGEAVGNITVTPADGKGTVLATTIVNKQGTPLPETGGIGTTIFYVVGGILVVGAGIVLVARRRMSAK